jgi:aldose 1-epimerase
MISVKKWGEYLGKDIFHYTLENSKGMKVGLTNFGCAVTSIVYDGIDVALGFDNPDGYIGQTCYLGVVVGRCANRIRGGLFELDGKQYQVGKNLGNNHLHGGFTGFDKVVWDVEEENRDENSVCFSYFSKDGEEGYPGNLTARVTYTLKEDCGLKIDYEATTDQATVINLANHTYFNLSGHGAGSIENQQIRICSDHFLETDAENVPTEESFRLPVRPLISESFTGLGSG